MSIKDISENLRIQSLAQKTGVPTEWADVEYVKTEDVIGEPIRPLDYKVHVKANDDGTETEMVHILFLSAEGNKMRLDTSATSVVRTFKVMAEEGVKVDGSETITLNRITTKRGQAIIIE